MPPKSPQRPQEAQDGPKRPPRDPNRAPRSPQDKCTEGTTKHARSVHLFWGHLGAKGAPAWVVLGPERIKKQVHGGGHKTRTLRALILGTLVQCGAEWCRVGHSHDQKLSQLSSTCFQALQIDALPVPMLEQVYLGVIVRSLSLLGGSKSSKKC